MLKNSILKSTLETKYGTHLTRKDVAYELNLSLVRLDTYKELHQIKKGRKYHIDDFISFLEQKTTHISFPKEKQDMKKIRTIYYWLYIKYQRLSVKMAEFLELINSTKVKLNRDQLDYRIKQKKNIPSYIKYHFIRFDIFKLAKYLSYQKWFVIPESTEMPEINIDTIRFHVENTDINQLLKYFEGNGYRYEIDDKNPKYGYKIFDPNEKSKSSMFRITKRKNKDRLPGISLEFYGLKTYNDSLDRNRELCKNLFLLFVKNNNLELQTYVTSLDLAFDFKTDLNAITVIRNSGIDFNKKIYKSLNDYSNRFYTSELYQKDKIIKLYKNAKVITFDELYSMATVRYIEDNPINDYEVELFSQLRKNKQQEISKKTFKSQWYKYDYDIVIFEKIIKLKYIYINNFNKKSSHQDKLKLKLNRPDNRVTIYDKAGKEGLDYLLSRIECTFDFYKKIPFNDFINQEIFRNILLERLNNYSLFINNCLFDFNNLVRF